jgi:retron-type reverse transcriptase
MTFAAVEASGLERWLAGLHEELVSKTCRPDPVRRVSIPKPDGGERPLGIPTIRDRVVQTAAKLVLEPIFEADFEDNAYGYRPVRGAVDAVKEVHRLICRGHSRQSHNKLPKTIAGRTPFAKFKTFRAWRLLVGQKGEPAARLPVPYGANWRK